VELIEEPGVDPGERVDAFGAPAAGEGLVDVEDADRAGVAQGVFQRVVGVVAADLVVFPVRAESGAADLQ